MQKHTIAVIIPCLDEELTIASVIQDYHKALPEAEIYVYDNDSTDHTAQQAVKAEQNPFLYNTRKRGRA